MEDDNVKLVFLDGDITVHANILSLIPYFEALMKWKEAKKKKISILRSIHPFKQLVQVIQNKSYLPFAVKKKLIGRKVLAHIKEEAEYYCLDIEIPALAETVTSEEFMVSAEIMAQRIQHNDALTGFIIQRNRRPIVRPDYPRGMRG